MVPLVLLNLKEQSLRDQNNRSGSWGLTVLGYAGRDMENVLASCRPKPQKSMLYQNLQLRQCGLTVLWCAGRIVKEECLLVFFFVILDLKEQGPRDQKRTLYLILQSGRVVLTVFVVCWLNFKE